MALGPRPKGFTRSGEDAEILTTLLGRRGVNWYTDGDEAVDQTWRRHVKTPEQFWLEGEHDDQTDAYD